MEAPIFKPFLVDSPPPPSLDEVKEFERKYDFTLPEDYVRFLLHTNGGKPNKATIYWVSERDFGGINNFYSMNTIFPLYDLGEAVETYREAQELPKTHLPFACDPGGNAYCLEASKAVSSSPIICWDHEEFDFDDDPIFDSFTSFLDSLRLYENYFLESIPLFRAIERGELSRVQSLIESGKARLEDRNEYGETALIIAALNQNPHICQYLLHLGADVNAADPKGRTALYVTNSVDVTQLLIDAGADTELRAENHRTVLLEALERSDQKKAICLIENGAEVHVSDARGTTTLDFCGPYKNEIVGPLIRKYYQ
jgi:hypothetical protein